MKEALEAIKNYQSKSTIVRTTIHDTDVFSYLEDEKYAYVNFLRIVHSAVIQVHTVELEKKIEEDKFIVFFFLYFTNTRPETITDMIFQTNFKTVVIDSLRI